MEKGNIKLSKSVMVAIDDISMFLNVDFNKARYNKHNQHMKLYKMVQPFTVNIANFHLLHFSTFSKSVSFVK